MSKVHVDYDLRSGIERLHVLLPDEADKLQRTPFAVVQVSHPTAATLRLHRVPVKGTG